jgi:phage terminase large subunit-like protein
MKDISLVMLIPSAASWRSALCTFVGNAQNSASYRAWVATLDENEIDYLIHDWSGLYARDDQLPPQEFIQGAKSIWLLMGGRGAGKTRAGSEWVRGMVSGYPEYTAHPARNIALIGETFADVRHVMIEGLSGLLCVFPQEERPVWSSSKRVLEWPNGAKAYAFSAEDPEALRGPQFDAAWCDEIGKWRYAQETWDMLQFGLRLGDNPRVVATTTPRPTPLIKQLLNDERVMVTRATTAHNAINLAPSFLSSITRQYGGTRLGRQELDGELIEERIDALWTRAMLEVARIRKTPELIRGVVAIDPPATSGKKADACGLVVAGIDANREVYVLCDATKQGLRPAQWASRVMALVSQYGADAVVAEVNQGGEMVQAVLKQENPDVRILSVHATRGKYTRAEPVAALYEQGRVHHVGAFPEMEDEMCDFSPEGLSTGKSPDRLDALVWAVTALVLKNEQSPRVRGL